MLSDVLIPMLDLNDTADPIEDYLAALRLLEGLAGASMSLSLAAGPSAQLIRYTHGSTRIGRTCTPCVTPTFPATGGSAHRPRTARIGCLARMNGNSSASPEKESATGRPARDPLATQTTLPNSELKTLLLARKWHTHELRWVTARVVGVLAARSLKIFKWPTALARGVDRSDHASIGWRCSLTPRGVIVAVWGQRMQCPPASPGGG